MIQIPTCVNYVSFSYTFVECNPQLFNGNVYLKQHTTNSHIFFLHSIFFYSFLFITSNYKNCSSFSRTVIRNTSSMSASFRKRSCNKKLQKRVWLCLSYLIAICLLLLFPSRCKNVITLSFWITCCMFYDEVPGLISI